MRARRKGSRRGIKYVRRLIRKGNIQFFSQLVSYASISRKYLPASSLQPPVSSMRHKYETRGMVLSRSPLGEANAFVTLLTPELGLVRARAQGVRRSGAKLSAALTTFAESSVVLVRGREGGRIAGSVLEENWFKRMQNAQQRRRASRVSGLLLRLVAGEAHDAALFPGL